MIRVARGTTADIEWVISEMQMFSEFFDSKIPLYNGDMSYMREWMTVAFEQHICLMAYDDQKPVGFIIGSSIRHPFNQTIKVLSEIFWWVTESARGTRAGLMLLNEFMKLGKDHDWVTLSVEAKSEVNERSLTKRGFKLQERAYLLEVSSCQPQPV